VVIGIFRKFSGYLKEHEPVPDDLLDFNGGYDSGNRIRYDAAGEKYYHKTGCRAYREY
jgi:hypothetical protein